MAAQKQNPGKKKVLNDNGDEVTLREFVVRLEQPGLYDKLYAESVRLTIEKGRRVPMTEITRTALEKHLK